MVDGLLIGLKTLFEGDSVTEIVFAQCEEGCDEEADQRMISNIHSIETKWISIHNYSDHMKWIKKLGLKKSHDLYVHLYNYNQMFGILYPFRHYVIFRTLIVINTL